MTDTGERITRLETKQEHLESTIDEMSEKLDKIYNILTKAEGITWFVVGVAGVIGFVVGSWKTIVGWIST